MNQQKTVIIGPTVKLDLPKLQLKRVPAKVDTGADSSAISASNIRLESGVLSFTLFDKSSRFYTGEPIRTRDFNAVFIKNSFGQVEERYRVKLLISLNGRTIHTRFNLADRSKQSYPILIGRRTLRGKFIVDVSRRKRSKTSRVLVLLSYDKQSVNQLFASIEKLHPNVQFVVAKYDDLVFSFNDEASKIAIGIEGVDIANYDMVYFKSVLAHRDVASTVAQYLQARGVDFFDEAVGRQPSITKLYQYARLANAGIRIPMTIFMSADKLPGAFDYIVEKLGLPFILKDIQSNKGENNFLVRNKRELNKILKQANHGEVRLITQVFIPNDGDYRILIFGDTISLAIFRKGAPHSHRNNTSTGGTAALVDVSALPSRVLADSLRAAKLLHRQVVGVDMVQDKTTKTWYCLEVNDGPQIASGAFVNKKRQSFAEFIQNRLRALGEV